MIALGSSLLSLSPQEQREYSMIDFESQMPRWCPGCGDSSVLVSMQRLLADEGMAPDQTVFVSGIGCSGRFPHYLNTYGFHGLHGRALPVATGVKLHRPDLNVFVVMGDGDCMSIGAGHWVHAVRYNTDMVALLLDNYVYGLTKNQTSPTTPQGHPTLSQPGGSYLPPLNPIAATLGISNASFVAQTAEWLPPHLYATLQAASRHKGFAFVRILQRCPKFTDGIFSEFIQHPEKIELLEHEHGVTVPALERTHKNRLRHDPRDLDAARSLAEESDVLRLGIFYRDPDRPTYEETRALPAHSTQEKLALLSEELDRHAI